MEIEGAATPPSATPTVTRDCTPNGPPALASPTAVAAFAVVATLVVGDADVLLCVLLAATVFELGHAVLLANAEVVATGGNTDDELN